MYKYMFEFDWPLNENHDQYSKWKKVQNKLYFEILIRNIFVWIFLKNILALILNLEL